LLGEDFPNPGRLFFARMLLCFARLLRLFGARLLRFAELGKRISERAFGRGDVMLDFRGAGQGGVAGRGGHYALEVFAFDTVRAQRTPPGFGKLAGQELFVGRLVLSHEPGFEILKGRAAFVWEHDLCAGKAVREWVQFRGVLTGLGAGPVQSCGALARTGMNLGMKGSCRKGDSDSILTASFARVVARPAREA